MGSQNFKPSTDAFPSMDQQFTGQGSQQQNQDPSANTMTANANPFSMKATTAKSFVPEGMVGFTDDYPNIGEAFGAAPKKKKQGPSQAEIDAKKKAELEALPTKGKEAPFFTVNGEPSKDQMLFVYQYYPQYSFNPVDILTWCFHEANRIKQMAAMAN